MSGVRGKSGGAKALPPEIAYAIREGHYLVAPEFHASHAFLCRLLYQDFAALQRGVIAILKQLDLSERSKLDALVTATACGAAMATFAAAHLAPFGWDNARLVHMPRDKGSGEIDAKRIPMKESDQCLVLIESPLMDETIAQVVKWVHGFGAKIRAIGALVDRRAEKATVEGVPVCAAIDLSGVGINADLRRGSCPLCAKGEALITNVRVV